MDVSRKTRALVALIAVLSLVAVLIAGCTGGGTTGGGAATSTAGGGAKVKTAMECRNYP